MVVAIYGIPFPFLRYLHITVNMHIFLIVKSSACFLLNTNSLLIVQLRIAEDVFELFDTDGQNELDEEELASALYALGFSQEGHFEVTSNHVMSMS